MRTQAHYQTLEFSRVERLFRSFGARAQGSLRVLDYGCGRGKYLRLLRSLDLQVVGCDFNPSYVEEARADGFVAYSPEELFETEGGYDVVLLSHLIEHLSPEQLAVLVPSLCGLLRPGGRLVLISPLLGERFYHDMTHIRPYYPQSIRHAFGQTQSEVSFGASSLLELSDIHFFKDPFKTRTWRSFYVREGLRGRMTAMLNAMFDFAWRASKGRIGTTTSWLGVYEKRGS